MRLSTTAHVRKTVRDNSADLLRYFLRRVDNPEDAADLVGETFVVLWRRASDLPAKPLEARMWLFGIARNVLLSHGRIAGKGERLSTLLREQYRSPEPEARSDSLDLERALLALPEPKRELVLLVHGDGLSIAEAAGLLGLNPSTARSRYSAALNELRELLDDTTVSSQTTSGPARDGSVPLSTLPQPQSALQ